MIGKILMGIMSLIIGLVNVLLAPIDALIASALPSLNEALTQIANMFTIARTYLAYIVDLTLLSSTAISIIIMYFSFVLVVPLAVSTVKLAIKWYNALKP